MPAGPSAGSRDSGGGGSRFTYANVVSTLCLFLIIAGGTALAVTAPANSVKSKSVKNESLKSVDLKDAKAVAGADVVDDSLTGADVRESSLDLDLPTSLPPSGPAGGDLAGAYPGPQIAADAVGGSEIADNAVGVTEIGDNAVGKPEVGTDAVGGNEISLRGVGADELGTFSTAEVVLEIAAGGGVGSVVAPCGAGSRLISGGASFEFPSGDISASTRDANNTNAWFAEGQNNGGVAQDLTALAICLNPPNS